MPTDNPNCIINDCRKADAKCSDCSHCGWDKDEYYRRRQYIAEHGLTDKDGVKRLVINKTEGETTNDSL